MTVQSERSARLIDTPYVRGETTFLYLAVFIGGMTTLAVELTASRLLGSVFGTSNLVWANVIGLMLLYLTVGYFIGGRWADRSPYHTTLYRILIWAAFLSALVPLLARPVLSLAAQSVVGAEAALAIGSFVSVLVLFSVPVTLMGCISPFAIRLAINDPIQAGKISGQIYAISTLGSLVGTFLPVVLLIPELGTFRTFLLFAGVLYTVGLIGLLRHRGSRALFWLWMPVLIGVIAVWALSGPLRSPLANATLLYEDESSYNYIQVQEDAQGYRYLYLNEGLGVHSIWHPNEYRYNGTWDYFLTAPYLNRPPYTPEIVDSVLVIGLATGTIPNQHFAVYGDDLHIDGVEIDPEIIEAGATYFEMNEEAMPGLSVYAQDGRYILNQLERQYNVIAIDAYRPPYIPWHMTTVEFFAEVRKHLVVNGVVAINVGRTSTDRRLVDALSATLAEVFPTVHALDVPNSFNTILYATMQPTSIENLTGNLELIDIQSYPLLADVMAASQSEFVEVTYSDIVFTDDRAPVETMVDALVINAIIGGETAQLK